MIHAYAVPEFDNQLGVFAAWNPTIWPRTEEAEPDWASSAATEVSDPTNKVSTIFDFEFDDLIEIEVGETMTFHNADTFVHTVTSGTPGEPAGEFDSGDMQMDHGFSLTLERPGTYPFYCRHHPGMMGSLVVTPSTR